VVQIGTKTAQQLMGAISHTAPQLVKHIHCRLGVQPATRCSLCAEQPPNAAAATRGDRHGCDIWYGGSQTDLAVTMWTGLAVHVSGVAAMTVGTWQMAPRYVCVQPSHIKIDDLFGGVLF
jgi:hypothetical protein